MDLELKGLSALVTGASRGIGYAIAMGLAREGVNLHLAARSSADLETARTQILAQYPVKISTYPLDLSVSQNINQLAAQCADVDILINNAGSITSGRLGDIDEARWREAWELKLFGYINLSREIYNAMVERNHGVILNIIGMAAEKPSFDYICGSTANAALVAFTKALGKGPHQKSVRVLGVNPPSTKTDRILKVMATIAKEIFNDETRIDDIPKDKMFQTLIDPEQVADAVVYLSSPRANQITGVVLNLAS
jgi:short-subunit dehydrogenase